MEYPSAEEILERYNISVSALEEASKLPFTQLRCQTIFAACTDEEIVRSFRDSRLEIDLGAILTLVASSEADLRTDLKMRTRGPRKKIERLTPGARDFALDSYGKPKLGDLVDFWREAIDERGHGPGSRYKSLLKLRHWIAHGRYWTLKSGIVSDVANTWATIDGFYTRIRRVDPGFPRL